MPGADDRVRDGRCTAVASANGRHRVGRVLAELRGNANGSTRRERFFRSIPCQDTGTNLTQLNAQRASAREDGIGPIMARWAGAWAVVSVGQGLVTRQGLPPWAGLWWLRVVWAAPCRVALFLLLPDQCLEAAAFVPNFGGLFFLQNTKRNQGFEENRGKAAKPGGVRDRFKATGSG